MRTPNGGARIAAPVVFLLVALGAAQLQDTAADCDLPSTLPNGQPIGDLMSHPEFQDKIRSVIKDFVMSSRASNTTEVSRWTSQAQLAAQFGMGDGSCPFPHNGWELSANRACGGMVTVAGIPGIQVELSINGRKTECFDDATPTPKGFQIGGLLTFFPPARNLTAARVLGDGEVLPSSAALTQSAAYCFPLSRKPTTKSGPLKEPALLLLATHWFGSGLNASCDPDFSILGAGASDLQLNILAACETKQSLPNGAGDPLGATTWHLKLQVSKSCTTGAVAVHQRELEGSVTFFDRINDVQTRSVFDISLPPPSPPPPPPVRTWPPAATLQPVETL